MESGAFDQGAFGQEEDDPFAASEQEFEAEREAALSADAAVEAERGTEAPVAEPPVVDREGQPVSPPPETTADGSPAEAQGAGVDPQAAPSEAEAAGSEAAAAPIAQAEAAEPPPVEERAAEPTQEQPAEDATQVAAEQQAAESVQPEPEAVADPPAAATGGEPSAAPEAAGEPAATEHEPVEDAAEPVEKKGSAKRKYLLFLPEGDGVFREVAWYENGEGKLVPKGTSGAKKQKVLLARGQEDALRHGHEVLGSPQEGSSLVAVAASYFQVRKVQPDSVQPVRQRLKIS